MSQTLVSSLSFHIYYILGSHVMESLARVSNITKAPIIACEVKYSEIIMALDITVMDALSFLINSKWR